MSILGRMLNPAWDAISSLPPQRRFEVARLVVFVGAWRAAVEAHCVDTLISQIHSTYGRFVSPAEKQTILSHLALAIARSSGPFTGFADTEDLVITRKVFSQMFERLLTTQLANADKAGTPRYDADGATARTQFLVNCARLLVIKDDQFSQQIAGGAFGKEWESTASVTMSGLSEGFRRTTLQPDYETLLFARAKSTCRDLSPALLADVRALASSVRDFKSDRRREGDKQQLAVLLEMTGKAGAEFLAQANARHWETHPGIPMFPGTTLREWRKDQAFVAGFTMVSVAVLLEGIDGKNGYSLEALLGAMAELHLERDMESMGKESRGLGFKGDFDKTPDPGMRKATTDLYRLYASNAKVCAASVKKGEPFPFQKLYEQLGPGFGRQADEATLAARYDDVVPPMIRDLRREVVKALLIQ